MAADILIVDDEADIRDLGGKRKRFSSDPP